MSPFALPATGTDPSPAFGNARAAGQWLSTQTLSSPAQTQSLLLGQINLLNRYRMGVAERLRILEILREPAVQAQHGMARRFSGRPLPLSAGERAGLDANLALWETLRTGYLHCLSAALSGDAAMQAQAALLCHRVLSLMYAQLLDSVRAAHMVPCGFWRLLHSVFVATQRLGVVEQTVTDVLAAEVRPGSVRAAYVASLLLQAASPYGLSQSALRRMAVWLQRYAEKVSISHSHPADAQLPAVCVDLDSDSMDAQHTELEGNRVWLNLDHLGRSLKKRLHLLAEGQSPASLHLGEDCSPAQADRLLRHLYIHCCRGGVARSQPRRGTHKRAHLVVGFDAVSEFLRAETVSDPLPAHLQDNASQITLLGGYQIEDWRVIDESASGMRLARELDRQGGRLSSARLLAVRPDDAGRFFIGVIQWALATPSGELHAGVKVLAGEPCVVGVRGLGARAIAGLLVPEVSALGQPACLVLPVDSWRRQQELSIEAQSSRPVRPANLLERGLDFDLIRCEALT